MGVCWCLAEEMVCGDMKRKRGEATNFNLFCLMVIYFAEN